MWTEVKSLQGEEEGWLSLPNGSEACRMVAEPVEWWLSLSNGS